MKEEAKEYKVDKSEWPDGPWKEEPDRVDFVHAGYACLLLRHARMGYWCAYVGIDNAHPLYEHHPLHENRLFDGLDGDLNYGDHCNGVICHVPAPGMPEGVWWLGMDFGHAFSLCPGLVHRERQMEERSPELREMRERLERDAPPFMREVYRDVAYVRHETEALAEQLRERAG
jgi:hypothetical protein